MSDKKLRIENRNAPRYNPEPEDAESALFFKNDITIKFPCDECEREVTDLSESGLKVFIEDEDPLVDLIGKDVKALLCFNNKTISLLVTIVHKTEDDYGLEYMGCKFINLSKANLKYIKLFLRSKKNY